MTDLPRVHSLVLLATESLIAWAIVWQTIEYLQIRRHWVDSGVWSWPVVRRELAGSWMVRVLDPWLNERGFVIVLGLRLALAALFPFWESAWLAWGLALSTWLVMIRWRGMFNGGSDYMTIIVLAVVTVDRTWGDRSAILGNIALGYLGLQTVLSFFIAGLAKLRGERWRSGEALISFLGSDYYGVPPRWQARAQWLSAHARLAKVFAWGIIGFECVFPLSLLHPLIAVVMVVMAICFQLLNAWIFGLNRFVWAWLAAYPALFWLSYRVGPLH